MKTLLIINMMICCFANAESTLKNHKTLTFGKIKSVFQMFNPNGGCTRHEAVICFTANTEKDLERKYDTKDCKKKIIKDTLNFGVVEVECQVDGKLIKSRFESETISPTKQVLKTFNGQSKLEMITTQVWIGDCE